MRLAGRNHSEQEERPHDFATEMSADRDRARGSPRSRTQHGSHFPVVWRQPKVGLKATFGSKVATETEAAIDASDPANAAAALRDYELAFPLGGRSRDSVPLFSMDPATLEVPLRASVMDAVLLDSERL